MSNAELICKIQMEIGKEYAETGKVNPKLLILLTALQRMEREQSS